ncbi:hypothetical protein A4A49_28139 [Nicotiana attenuata]|uniref:Uncharacterized protein n=1 Tax=Nicotiana attenuata TaxID=49451 RepID=A0A314LDE0_NICAT|nr:hypothetical protein A4A49_28139 [Nicotiana attenuata]
MATYSISLTTFLTLALIIVPNYGHSRSLIQIEDYSPPRASHCLSNKGEELKESEEFYVCPPHGHHNDFSAPKQGVEINDYPPTRPVHGLGIDHGVAKQGAEINDYPPTRPVHGLGIDHGVAKQGAEINDYPPTRPMHDLAIDYDVTKQGIEINDAPTQG